MKYLKFFLFIILFFSCRGNDDDVQKIDQVLKIYVTNSAGEDLLNTAVAGAYYSVGLVDLDAVRDRVSVSSILKTDLENTKYLEYIAGATRTLQSGGTDTYKIYKSTLAIQYRKESTGEPNEDILEIYYEWTPQLFQLKTINLNGVSVFEKAENQENRIRIVK
ncbi:MAG: hypothetical protein Q4C75_05175 [Bergeyella zoohelcum]|nr:hypothetical protein [Bergeyella zoohelcum]